MPAYRSHTAATVSSGTFTLTIPSGAADGDLLIAWCTSDNPAGLTVTPPTPPSGANWSQFALGAQSGFSNAERVQGWWKPYVVAEGSQVFTVSGATAAAGSKMYLVAISSADLSNAPEATSSGGVNGGTLLTISALTTLGADRLLILCGGPGVSGPTITLGGGTPPTLRESTPGVSYAGWIGDEPWPTQSSTGTRTATAGGGNYGRAFGWMAAVKPVQPITVTPNSISVSLSAQTPLAAPGNVTVASNSLNITISPQTATATAVGVLVAEPNAINVAITPQGVTVASPVTIAVGPQNITVGIEPVVDPLNVDAISQIIVISPHMATVLAIPPVFVTPASIPISVQGQTATVAAEVTTLAAMIPIVITAEVATPRVPDVNAIRLKYRERAIFVYQE